MRHAIGARPVDPRLRWLILSPHPDDETLGAGAVVAEAARAGRLAGVAYLTDGGASHRLASDERTRLVHVRKSEAKGALRHLAGRRAPLPFHLDWSDASPETAGSDLFESSRRRLGTLIRRRRVTAIAVTALNEPHCDHQAAAELAYVCAADAGHHVSVFEYLVWSGEPAARMAAYVTGGMQVGVRRRALARHRSQLTGLMGEGFRLPRGRLAMPSKDILFRKLKP